MNIDLPLDKCTGCSACYVTCPIGCISIRENPEGFMQPEIDVPKCSGCGRCVSVCPVLEQPARRRPIKGFCGFHTDSRITKRSSSGGVYSAITQSILDDGGVAFGAVYGDDGKIVHHADSDSVPVSCQTGSKYVESDLGDSFLDVKKVLQSGRQVVFSGTPCQIAGLYAYLGSRPDNLLTVDFVCHGVASRKIYLEYFRNMEAKYGTNIRSINFRPKLVGWHRHSIAVSFENGKEYHRDAASDPYFAGFMAQNLFLKKACYTCQFRGAHQADITIADFWGRKIRADIPDNDTGLSLVLLNSEKSIGWISFLAGSLRFFPLDSSNYEYAFSDRDPIDYGIKRRDVFFQDYFSQGLAVALHQHVRLASWRRRVVFQVHLYMHRMKRVLDAPANEKDYR